MIILDTYFVSEPIRLRSDAALLYWLDRQAAEMLYVTATSLADRIAPCRLAVAKRYLFRPWAHQALAVML